MLLAHDADEVFGRVGVVRVGGNMRGRIVADSVLVAAGDVDGVAADAHTRAGDESGVDGVADGGRGGSCAFGSHVALRGEAGQQVSPGGKLCLDHALRHAFLNRLQVFGSGMQEQMDVGVDEARHQRAFAQVDDLAHLGAYLGDALGQIQDAVTLHHHHAGRDGCARLHVQDSRRLQHDHRAIAFSRAVLPAAWTALANGRQGTRQEQPDC